MRKYYIGIQIYCLKLYFTSLIFLGILLPLPAVVVTLADRNFSYTINAFPPLLCVSRSADLTYYSAILVVNVLLAIGVSLFIPMFWVVHKVSSCITNINHYLPLLFFFSIKEYLGQRKELLISALQKGRSCLYSVIMLYSEF